MSLGDFSSGFERGFTENFFQTPVNAFTASIIENRVYFSQWTKIVSLAMIFAMLSANWLKEVLPCQNLLSPVNRDKFSFKAQGLAALVAAILVIPQGISFSYLAGVPVTHGLACAVVVTFIAALFGQSITMSGPNTATSILLGLSAAPFVEAGVADQVELVLLLTLLVGFVQMLVWFSRSARIIDTLDKVAIAGLTHGVGVLIIVSSFFSLFGVSSIIGSTIEKLNYLRLEFVSEYSSEYNFYAIVIGVSTILAGLIASRFFSRVYIILALLAGLLTFSILHFFIEGPLGIHFLPPVSAAFIRPQGVRFFTDMGLVLELLPAAFSIAVISLTHNLVIAKDLKLHFDESINLHKEVFAIAIANIVAPFFQAFAGAGSFNRTQVHREMQAQSTASAIFSAILALIFILVFGEFFSYLPDALIGGVLFIVGLRMIRPQQIKEYLPSRWQSGVFFTVFLSVVFWGLVPAVTLALILSVFKKYHFGTVDSRWD